MLVVGFVVLTLSLIQKNKKSLVILGLTAELFLFLHVGRHD